MVRLCVGGDSSVYKTFSASSLYAGSDFNECRFSRRDSTPGSLAESSESTVFEIECESVELLVE